MAHLKPCPSPQLLAIARLPKQTLLANAFHFKCRVLRVNGLKPSLKGGVLLVRCLQRGSSAANLFQNGSRRGASWVCENNSSAAVGGVSTVVGESEEGVLQDHQAVVSSGYVVDEGQFGYLMSENGWSVRRMGDDQEEWRKVAQIQAQAFYQPKPLFNHYFFQFFQADVLAALIYKVRNWHTNMYACLVAEHSDASNPILLKRGPAGVADVTVLQDTTVLIHLDGAEEYLYVSGIAVLEDFRRRKVATTLLKACDLLANLWGFNYLALRANEDDSAARKLYSNAGYKVVSRDAYWTTWIGRKRRVLMIKQSGLRDRC